MTDVMIFFCVADVVTDLMRFCEVIGLVVLLI